MICKNCGAEMQDGMKYCTVCGTPLTDYTINLDKPNYSADEQPTMPDATMPDAVVPVENNESDTAGQQGYGDTRRPDGSYDYDRLNPSYGGDPRQNSAYGAQNAQSTQGGYPGGQPGYGAQPGYGTGAPMMGMTGITERSIVTCIILSVVTCGIYAIYWMYCLTEDTNRFANEPNPVSGGMSVLLSLVTCGIYTWYWMYKRGDYLDNYATQRGLPPQSNSILYLILSICGLGIVSYCLMQSELNKIARGM